MIQQAVQVVSCGDRIPEAAGIVGKLLKENAIGYLKPAHCLAHLQSPFPAPCKRIVLPPFTCLELDKRDCNRETTCRGTHFPPSCHNFPNSNLSSQFIYQEYERPLRRANTIPICPPCMGLQNEVLPRAGKYLELILFWTGLIMILSLLVQKLPLAIYVAKLRKMLQQLSLPPNPFNGSPGLNYIAATAAATLVQVPRAYSLDHISRRGSPPPPLLYAPSCSQDNIT